MDQNYWQLAAVVFAAIAGVASATTALLSYILSRSLRDTNRYTLNYQAAAVFEGMIAEHPTLLDLHGYTSQKLTEIRATQVEVAYLISSFTAGDLFYRDRQISELTQSRKTLLGSRRVRRIWADILKDRFILEGPLSQLVESYVASSPADRD